MADQLPVPAGGGAVAVHGGGAVATADDVGDVSVDRGATAHSLTPQQEERRQKLIQSWEWECAPSSWTRGRTLKWLAKHEPEFKSMREEVLAAQDERDKETGVAALRGEWGTAYDSNIKRIKVFLDSLDHEFAETFLHARDAAGTAICNKPAVLRGLLDLAKRGGHTDDIDRDMRELEALMRDPSSRYWKGPEAEQLQGRYRNLINLRDQRRA